MGGTVLVYGINGAGLWDQRWVFLVFGAVNSHLCHEGDHLWDKGDRLWDRRGQGPYKVIIYGMSGDHLRG